MVPKGFGHEKPPMLINAKRDRIGQHRLRGEQFDPETFWHANAAQGTVGFARGL
jgi:hypothetical protein